MWDEINLTACTGLEDFTIATTMCPFTWQLPDAAESKMQQNSAILRLLSRLSPTVRHISIILYEGDPEMGTLRSCYDWTQITGLLTMLSSQLNAVTFRICDTGDGDSHFPVFRKFVLEQSATVQRKVVVKAVEQKQSQWW